MWILQATTEWAGVQEEVEDLLQEHAPELLAAILSGALSEEFIQTVRAKLATIRHLSPKVFRFHVSAIWASAKSRCRPTGAQRETEHGGNEEEESTVTNGQIVPPTVNLVRSLTANKTSGQAQSPSSRSEATPTRRKLDPAWTAEEGIPSRARSPTSYANQA